MRVAVSGAQGNVPNCWRDFAGLRVNRPHTSIYIKGGLIMYLSLFDFGISYRDKAVRAFAFAISDIDIDMGSRALIGVWYDSDGWEIDFLFFHVVRR
jgi:hypothetical protein